MNKTKFKDFLQAILTDPFEKEILQQELKDPNVINDLYLSLFTEEFAGPYNEEFEKLIPKEVEVHVEEMPEHGGGPSDNQLNHAQTLPVQGMRNSITAKRQSVLQRSVIETDDVFHPLLAKPLDPKNSILKDMFVLTPHQFDHMLSAAPELTDEEIRYYQSKAAKELD